MYIADRDYGLQVLDVSRCNNPADFNRDDVVNSADLAIFLTMWGPANGSSADFNRNGVVGADDLATFLAAWD